MSTTTNTPFDSAPYKHTPAITVSSGIALARALHEATPADAEPRVRKSSRYLAHVADQAEKDFSARNRQLGAFSEEDSRVLDNESDRCWRALDLRLEAASLLVEHSPQKAARAGALRDKLFHGSLAFLKAQYPTQSNSTAAILRLIDEEHLAHEVDELCGREYLAACRAVQPRYEAMVLERLKRDEASGQNLAATVHALQNAIQDYAEKVVATVDRDDPATAEVARKALLPMVRHRELSRRSGGASEAASAGDAGDAGAEVVAASAKSGG